MDVRPASGHAAPAQAGEAQAKLAKLKADNAMAEAIRNGRPLIGMTRQQLIKAMGTPTLVNANNYQGTQQEQNIFERPNETWMVYTRNGVVTDIQHRPGRPVGQGNSKLPCPSSHELRDARVSASSATASQAAKDRYKSLLEQERNCQR